MFYEIQLETFANQAFSTTINNEDVFFEVRTFGNELFFTGYTNKEYLFSGIRLPLGNLFHVKQLGIYLGFTGSYDWKDLNISSFLYYTENP